MEKFLLTLVRHGETEENKLEIIQGHLNTKLTVEGKRQAECLGKGLKKEVFTHIFTSDLARASDTCKIITNLNETGIIETTVDPKLRERKLGKLEGRYRSQCFSQTHDPDIETKTQLRKRAVCFFEEMCGKVTSYKNAQHNNITATIEHNNITATIQDNNVAATVENNNITAKIQYSNNSNSTQHKSNTTTPHNQTTKDNTINNIQNLELNNTTLSNDNNNSTVNENTNTNIDSKVSGHTKKSGYVSQVQSSKGSKTRTSGSCHCIDLITSTLFKTSSSYCQCSSDEQQPITSSSVISSLPSTLSSALASSPSELVSSPTLQDSLPISDTTQPANDHSTGLSGASMEPITLSKPSSSPQLSSSLQQPSPHNISKQGCADIIDDDDDDDGGGVLGDDHDGGGGDAKVEKDTDIGNDKDTIMRNGHKEDERKVMNKAVKDPEENGVWKAEKDGDYAARVMVVSHGGFLTELITYFFKDLKCEHLNNGHTMHNYNTKKDTKQNDNKMQIKNTKTNTTHNKNNYNNNSQSNANKNSTTTNNTTTTPPITTYNGIKLGQMSNAGVSRFEVSIKMGKVKRISCICLNNIDHLE